MRGIAILGSTGSIGKQAIEVISLHPDRFFVTALTAHRNAALLFEQVRLLRPKMAALKFRRIFPSANSGSALLPWRKWPGNAREKMCWRPWWAWLGSRL